MSDNMMFDQILTAVTQFFSLFNGEVVLGLVAMSVLLSLTLLLSLKKVRKLAKQVTRIQHDLKVSNTSMINIGQQLLSLEKNFNQQVISEPVNSNFNTLHKMAKGDSKVTSGFQIDDSQSAKTQTNNTLINNSQVDNGDSIYDEARYYLANGDSVEDIAKRCNLSHAEVSLLKALSKKPAETV